MLSRASNRIYSRIPRSFIRGINAHRPLPANPPKRMIVKATICNLAHEAAKVCTVYVLNMFYAPVYVF